MENEKLCIWIRNPREDNTICDNKKSNKCGHSVPKECMQCRHFETGTNKIDEFLSRSGIVFYDETDNANPKEPGELSDSIKSRIKMYSNIKLDKPLGETDEMKGKALNAFTDPSFAPDKMPDVDLTKVTEKEDE